MIYNLFKKEEADTWEKAKEKLIKSISLDENRIDGKYEKAFPKGFKYTYDEKNHFVHEGQLTGPYIIQPDFTLYFLNDREQIEKGYKVLGIGEILERDKIKAIPSPGLFYEWKEDRWMYNISPHKTALITEVEKTKDEILSNGFLWNGKYQQKCRAEKDIPYIRESLENFNLMTGYTQVWYFSNYPKGYLFKTKEEFLGLRNAGMLFTNAVFDTESCLKQRIESAAAEEDLAFNVIEEYNKGLAGFTLPE